MVGKINRYLIIVYLTLGLLCCGKKSGNKQSLSTGKLAIYADSLSMVAYSAKIQQVGEVKEVIGLLKDSIVEKWGQPNETDVFVLDDALPEFRVELYNHITKNRYRNNTIVIEELTWKKDSLNNITIWFEKNDNISKFVHYMQWNKNVEF